MNLDARDGGLVFFPERRIVWGKIGKAAGTSLLQVFESHWGKAVHAKNDWMRYRRLDRHDMQFNPRAWFRVVFVRNPFARFASLYRYWLKVGLAPAGETFGEFVDRFYDRYIDQVFRLHAMPAENYLFPWSTAIGFVGQVERIDRDVGRLFTALGDEAPAAVPKLNASTAASDWRTLYDDCPEAVHFVLEFYGGDFGDDPSTLPDRVCGYSYLRDYRSRYEAGQAVTFEVEAQKGQF
jgi:hypothetical protein